MADQFGIDIKYSHHAVAGDIPTIEGLANYRQALISRWITTKGEYAARPEYGAGVRRYKDELMGLSKQKQLAKDIEEQTLLDPRTEKVLSISIEVPNSNPGLLIINVRVKPVGYEAFGITYTPFAEEA